MKPHALAVVAMLVIPLSPAGAQQQDPRGAAAQRVFNWCMRLPTGSQPECGCVAGFYAGATADDEFRLIGAMVDYITPDGGISDNGAMVAAMMAEKNAIGMSQDRFNEIVEGFGAFGELGAKADGVCVPVEKAASE